MKHTRVPRTVRRNIWQLAMETLSIPSLHIFWSRIRNQIKSRIENRKKTNGPSRKSNRLKKIKKIHIPCATLDYYLGWLMRCNVYVSYEPLTKLLSNKALRGNSISRFYYFRPNDSALRKLCTSINQPYLIWDAVPCHVPPPKDQGDWYPQTKKRRRNQKKNEVVEVRDVVELSKCEDWPASESFILTYWWLSQLTLNYPTLKTA